MASAHPVSAPVQPAPVPHLAAPPTSTPAASQAASPPSKQNLKTWWKTFSKGGPGKNQDTQGISPQLPYKTQCREGSMNKDVLVAEDVLRRLLEEPPKASQSGSRHQRTPLRARRPGMQGRLQVAGREWQSLIAAALLSGSIILVAEL